jgi:hypothetical protein
MAECQLLPVFLPRVPLYGKSTPSSVMLSRKLKCTPAILILECVVLPKWAEELPREGGGRMTGVESNECRVNRDPSTNWC